MNIFTRIGNWVEKHFPEKMTTEEVHKMFQAYRISLDEHEKLLGRLTSIIPSIEDRMIVHQKSIESLTSMIKGMDQLAFLLNDSRENKKSIEQLEKDFNMIKNQLTVKTRMSTSPLSSMTPFASRPTTYIPPALTKAGNQSPQ